MKKEDIPMTIQITRKAMGMTQDQMADFLEIPKRTIEDWERGVRTPPIYVVKLIRYRLLGY